MLEKVLENIFYLTEHLTISGEVCATVHFRGIRGNGFFNPTAQFCFTPDTVFLFHLGLKLLYYVT